MSRNYEQTQDESLEMYFRQYYQIRNHIQTLNEMLDEINLNIINITNSQIIRNRANRNNNLFNRRNNSYIRYDYNAPISHSLYNYTSSNNNANANANTNANVETTASANESATLNTNTSATSNVETNRNTTTRRNRQRNAHSNFYRQFFDSFIENVPIIPTQREIENATRLVKYGDMLDPISECCPITLERFNMNDMVREIRSCGHIFSQSSFNEWFRSNVRCPVCRYDIRTYNSNTTVNSINDLNNNDNSSNNSTGVYETNVSSENVNITSNSLGSNNLLSSLSSRIIRELLNSSSNNESIMYDASNNMFYFETIINPNNGYGNI